ncbi:hypothetical protein [Geotoga petraea]|jgi:hypothetical protein|uniref:Uncharacterized protein n=1 Tax=Geotoga petraea TaxID=28234 RepID=A0A4Z0VU18_9BACT|nr:hypothetical protein [Geotoga petraea]MDK2945987.1 hypothetical protein [Geotoga sp.]TGG87355.1 hypothetical protein E4650_08610 [Geotoga petraea]
MKYYSKSPKEWEEYDQEKRENKKDRYKTIRKYTSYLIIFIAIMALIFTFFGPRLSRFNLSYNIVIDGISFNLVTEDQFLYPEKITSNVNVQNTTNNDKTIKIDNFYYEIIKSENNETIFDFEHNETVTTILSPYQTRLIFDLEKETEISELESGKYIINTSFEFNGQKVNLNRDFNYNQDFKLNFYSDRNFYLESETPKFVVTFQNNSKEMYNKEVFGKLIYSKDGENIYERQINFGSLELQPLESSQFEITSNRLFESGIYRVMFDIESMDKKIITTLNIANQINSNPENIAINDFTLQTFEQGQKLYYKAYLDNKVKNPQSLIMNSYGIRIQYNGEELYNYRNDESTRVYISEYGSTEIFDLENVKEIELNKKGRYFINFFVEVQGKIITTQNSIEVR